MCSRLSIAVLLSCLFFLLHPARGMKKTDFRRSFRGDGTYYGYTAGGNCAMRGHLPAMYSGMLPVALNDAQYGDSGACGACLLITHGGRGSGGSPIDTSRGPIRAYVHDRCPECHHGDLDLSKSGDGRWSVKWHFVPCPAAAGAPRVQVFFEGSNRFYRKMQIRGLAAPVAEFVAAGVRGKRTQDNFFIFLRSTPWPSLVPVRIRTVLGQNVRGVLRSWKADGIVMLSNVQSSGGKAGKKRYRKQMKKKHKHNKPRRRKHKRTRRRNQWKQHQQKKRRQSRRPKRKWRKRRTWRLKKCANNWARCGNRWTGRRCCSGRFVCRRKWRRGPMRCLPLLRAGKCIAKWKPCGGRRTRRCCHWRFRCKWVNWGKFRGRACVKK